MVYSDAKKLYVVRCLGCFGIVSRRAIRSVLLSNTRIKLYSTNDPTENVRCVRNSYTTYSCQCLIEDISCRLCRVMLGYHIVSPCIMCTKAKNNGHMWMFDTGSVSSISKDVSRRMEFNDSLTFYNEYDHEINIR